MFIAGQGGFPSPASYRYCSPFGWDFSSLWFSLRVSPTMLVYGARLLHNRGEAVRVVRVVVAYVARSIDIPAIVRVATIATTKSNTLRLTYVPRSAYLLASAWCHEVSRFRVLRALFTQYSVLPLFRWYILFAMLIYPSKLLTSEIAFFCIRFLASQSSALLTLMRLAV